jgi:enediyne biosynthesis protein E4
MAIVLAVAFARIFPAAVPPVDQSPPRFIDVTAESGISFVHRQGAGPSPTTLGGGIAVIDYDRDGYPDLFFVNGTAWPWDEPEHEEPSSGARSTCALFRNEGNGKFTDVSRAAGVDFELQGMAAAVGDFDGDGWPDIYVTSIGRNRLLRNRGDASTPGFVDVTESADVGGDDQTWSTGAAWLDYDGDSRLDLVVCRYARWPREIELELAFKIAGVGRSYGAPAGFVSASPLLYRNLGDGRFAEVAAEAGLRNLDPQTGLPRPLPLVVAPLDANNDGRLDLLFVHHGPEHVLFLSQSDGTFREWHPTGDRRPEGAAAGLAATGAFPLAADTQDDPRLHAWRSLVLGERRTGADPGSLESGRRGAFALLDYDLGGHAEVVLARSRFEPDLNRFDEDRAFAGPLAFLTQRGDSWLPVTGGDAGGPPAARYRGLAVADLDQDGDLDLVTIEHHGPARIYRNEQRSNAPWLRLHLEPTRSAPGAGGARIEVHTPRQVQVQTQAPAMGLLAQSEATLTFGLGADSRVRRIVIVWPSGERQELRSIELNRTLTVPEP